MKKIFLMTILLVCTVIANAQNEKGKFTIAPTLGMNLTNITDYEDSKVKAGMVIGANGEYGITDRIGISAGIMFSMQGAKWSGDGWTEKERLNYVNIPILANFYLYKGLAVKTGIQPGVLLNAKYVEKEDGEKDTESFTDECHKFDFAIPIGVSYEYKRFVIDARYNIHVTKAYKDDEGNSRNSVFQLALGYKF